MYPILVTRDQRLRAERNRECWWSVSSFCYVMRRVLIVAFICSHYRYMWSLYFFCNRTWVSKRTTSAFERPWYSFMDTYFLCSTSIFVNDAQHTVCTPICHLVPTFTSRSIFRHNGIFHLSNYFTRTRYCNFIWPYCTFMIRGFPRPLPKTCIIGVTAPILHFNYAVLSSCTCSLSGVWKPTSISLPGGSLSADRFSTISVRYVVLPLKMSVRCPVVVDRVRITLPSILLVANLLLSLFSCSFARDSWRISLAICSSYVRPNLSSAYVSTVAIIAFPWCLPIITFTTVFSVDDLLQVT